MMKYPEPTVGAIIFNPDNKVLLCKAHKWNDKYIIPKAIFAQVNSEQE